MPLNETHCTFRRIVEFQEYIQLLFFFIKPEWSLLLCIHSQIINKRTTTETKSVNTSSVHPKLPPPTFSPNFPNVPCHKSSYFSHIVNISSHPFKWTPAPPPPPPPAAPCSTCSSTFSPVPGEPWLSTGSSAAVSRSVQSWLLPSLSNFLSLSLIISSLLPLLLLLLLLLLLSLTLHPWHSPNCTTVTVTMWGWV